MNIVLIIPTGVGAEIGGHAGDGNPVAKLFGGLCDKLITHPNVVNASDINEMPENTLYVEGSILDRFLRGEICLKEVDYNKILLVTNSPLESRVANSVSAARATIGADVEIAVLTTPLIMNGWVNNNRAGGNVTGWKELIEQVKDYDFDALAITSPINISPDVKLNYWRNGGINPWGGIEAKLSKLIATGLSKPVAHSPMDTPEDIKNFNFHEVVDPRIAAEMVSISYLHCILKGLHKAPRISSLGISVDSVSFLVTPMNCIGAPHLACIDEGITIIAVKENKTYLDDKMPEEIIQVENYWEAAGYISCVNSGVNPVSVRRPLEYTKCNI